MKTKTKVAEKKFDVIENIFGIRWKKRYPNTEIINQSAMNKTKEEILDGYMLQRSIFPDTKKQLFKAMQEYAVQYKVDWDELKEKFFKDYMKRETEFPCIKSSWRLCFSEVFDWFKSKLEKK